MVKEISVTQFLGDNPMTPEELIIYTARVSSPANQKNHATAPRLIKYLINHKHWSPFEMVDWTVEIYTSRAIAAQILRHRSFSFQEFSQRYATVDAEEFPLPEMRMVHKDGNRQGSGEVCHDERINGLVINQIQHATDLYARLLEQGIAPETARMVLPLCTPTRLYMKGSVRSWIHYFSARCDPHAQKEHRLIAKEIRNLFIKRFPQISAALDYRFSEALDDYLASQ